MHTFVTTSYSPTEHDHVLEEAKHVLEEAEHVLPVEEAEHVQEEAKRLPRATPRLLFRNERRQ